MKITGAVLWGAAGLLAGVYHDGIATACGALMLLGCIFWDIGSTKTLWDD